MLDVFSEKLFICFFTELKKHNSQNVAIEVKKFREIAYFPLGGISFSIGKRK